ncbi:hypothetical protein QVD17_00935 [Tagetes erecta]|uniref:Uncharacterized protein n=1 Tax=Tagetes erecta TaxID=13708 RepID=A0AAD8L6P7_TARER|nr:hypothetical protein QVD17_00935 [Tagetes erecta]
MGAAEQEEWRREAEGKQPYPRLLFATLADVTNAQTRICLIDPLLCSDSKPVSFSKFKTYHFNFHSPLSLKTFILSLSHSSLPHRFIFSTGYDSSIALEVMIHSPLSFKNH